MKGKREVIFDIEGNGLLRDLTKIHCLCWREKGKDEIHSITTYQEMREFFSQPDMILIGHNIILFDIPVAERILGIKITADRCDTLLLSQLKETKRKKHGLETYGDESGIPKPKVTDWSDQPIEVYIHRCTEDVKINSWIWDRQSKWLYILYDYDEEQVYRYIKYIEFKFDCVEEQEKLGLNANMKQISELADKLRILETEKIKEIEKVMPPVEIIKKKKYKDAVQDNSGFVAEFGDLFFNSIVEKNDGVKFIDEIRKVVGHKDPNAASYVQIKNWLFSLGWEPDHFKFVRDKETGEVKQIPQIGSKEKDGTISPSIKKLYEKEPKLELLEGLSIISHRLTICDGFLRDAIDGRLYASAKGLTNTMRLKHSVVVNLPDPNKAYGKEIRGSIVADEGCTLIGTDLSGVEDSTKRHYIWKYDPKYVEEMNIPGFDPHLDIAVRAGVLTQEEADGHKLYEKTSELHKKDPSIPIEGKSQSAKRKKAKVTNFSATYKIGANALSRDSGMALNEATKFLDIYWARNWAIKKIEENTKVKEVAGQKWLFNPISKFWYSLRDDKDIFSTLNQGTAVYVFDVWLGYCRKLGMKVAFQMHDEHLSNAPIGTEDEVKAKITEAIRLTNEKLKLNVTIGCETKTGPNYADVH